MSYDLNNWQELLKLNQKQFEEQLVNFDIEKLVKRVIEDTLFKEINKGFSLLTRLKKHDIEDYLLPDIHCNLVKKYFSHNKIEKEENFLKLCSKFNTSADSWKQSTLNVYQYVSPEVIVKNFLSGNHPYDEYRFFTYLNESVWLSSINDDKTKPHIPKRFNYLLKDIFDYIEKLDITDVYDIKTNMVFKFIFKNKNIPLLNLPELPIFLFNNEQNYKALNNHLKKINGKEIYQSWKKCVQKHMITALKCYGLKNDISIFESIPFNLITPTEELKKEFQYVISNYRMNRQLLYKLLPFVRELDINFDGERPKNYQYIISPFIRIDRTLINTWKMYDINSKIFKNKDSIELENKKYFFALAYDDNVKLDIQPETVEQYYSLFLNEHYHKRLTKASKEQFIKNMPKYLETLSDKERAKVLEIYNTLVPKQEKKQWKVKL